MGMIRIVIDIFFTRKVELDGKKGKVGIMRKCFFVLILSLAGVMPCMGETSKSLSASDVSVLNRRGLDLLATCCGCKLKM